MTMSPTARHSGASQAAGPPLISVVLPTYQRGHIVAQAISSVLRQTYRLLELIVVDDGSTDGTAEVVSRFEDRRLRLVSLEHVGRSQARNEGASRARGDVVVFLDSDDAVAPAWLERLSPAFGDPAVAVTCCGAQVTTERPPRGVAATTIIMPRRLDAMYSNRIGLFRAGTFAVRRHVFQATGGYDARLAFSENSELAIRLAVQCDERALCFAAVYEPLVLIRRSRDRGGHAELRERLEAIEMILERHRVRYRQAGRASYGNYRAVAGACAYRLGFTRRAIRHFAAAATANPLRPLPWGRLALALASPLAHRFWRHRTDLGRAHEPAAEQGTDTALDSALGGL